jgi:hypothetical protein
MGCNQAARASGICWNTRTCRIKKIIIQFETGWLSELQRKDLGEAFTLAIASGYIV